MGGLLDRFFKRNKEPEIPVGAMLTGRMIYEEVQAGRISITGFNVDYLNPNSYNITIGDKVSMYQNITAIDLKNKETYSGVTTLAIPEEGMVLRPGILYLIPTDEKIRTDYYIPLITGRSSIGRLGIAVHQEAGFGDLGYDGVWTMQIKVTYPTRIYPHIPMGQVYFLTPHGPVSELYRGKYQKSETVAPSKWAM